MVDHEILINHLEHWVGLKGNVLKWFKSDHGQILRKIIKSAKKYESVTPLLILLKWLQVQFRIIYKILHNLAPVYLSSMVAIYTPSRSLRSESQHLLCAARTKYKHRSDRAFSRAGPKLWNDLPQSIQSAKSLPMFKAMLKQHLLNTNGELFFKLVNVYVCVYVMWVCIFLLSSCVS